MRITSSIGAARRRAISKSATGRRATTRSIRTTTCSGSRTKTAFIPRTRTAGRTSPFVARLGIVSGDFGISSAQALTRTTAALTFDYAARARRPEESRTMADLQVEGPGTSSNAPVNAATLVYVLFAIAVIGTLISHGLIVFAPLVGVAGIACWTRG